MPSPFPGMDPYIEIHHLWEDFHLKLIGDIERALSAILPDRYVVRTGERSYVALAELEEEQKRPFVPDVAIGASPRGGRTARKPKRSNRDSAVPSEFGGAVTMRAIVKEEFREPFLEICQVDPQRKLVTGIEVLSPSNKRPSSKGWRLYYRKRLAYLSGHANFVELDLLRMGRRMPMASKWPDSPYYLLVCRKKQAPRCTVWPAYFTEPLPAIPIPLSPPDSDIRLELQPLVEAIYARSRYERDIDYRQPLGEPLRPAEQTWLEERIRPNERPRPSH